VLACVEGLHGSCLCCYQEKQACDLNTRPASRPCSRCAESGQLCKVLSVESLTTDNDSVATSLHRSLPQSILPFLDDLHLAKSYIRTLRSWFVSWGTHLDVVPLNWLAYLSAATQQYNRAARSVAIKECLRPFAVKSCCMMHQRNVLGHCGISMQTAVETSGHCFVSLCPPHDTPISAPASGAARAVLGHSALAWSSVLGGTLWVDEARSSTSFLPGSTPLGAHSAESQRVLPVLASDETPVGVLAVCDIGTDRQRPVCLAALPDGRFARLVRKGKHVQVGPYQPLHTAGLAAVLAGAATPRNSAVAMPASTVVSMRFGQSALSRCLVDLFLLTDHGHLIATCLHCHDTPLQGGEGFWAASQWSTEEPARCPLNGHLVLNTPYDTTGMAYDVRQTVQVVCNPITTSHETGLHRANGVFLVASGVSDFDVRNDPGGGYTAALLPRKAPCRPDASEDSRPVSHVSMLPESSIFCDRLELAGADVGAVFRPVLHIDNHQGQRLTVTDGPRARREGVEPVAAPGGGWISSSVRRLRADKVPSTIAPLWRPVNVARSETRNEDVVLSVGFAGHDLCGLVWNDRNTRLCKFHEQRQCWIPLTRRSIANPRLGQKTVLGALDMIKLPPTPSPTQGRSTGTANHSGHGVGLVKCGASISLSVCACATCGFTQVRDWRASYPASVTAAMPSMVLLSAATTVVESMRVLNSYLQASGLVGSASRSPRPDHARRLVASATSKLLEVVRPTSNIFSGHIRPNGDSGHFSAKLAYGLKRNLLSLESTVSFGSRLDGYMRVSAAAGGDEAAARAATAELNRVRRMETDARSYKTLSAEGTFGIARQNGDRRFSAGAATSMLRGVRKAQALHVRRMRYSASMLRYWLSRARPQEVPMPRQPPSGRLNYVRSRATKKRKLAYDQQGHRTVDVSAPQQGDLRDRESISTFALPMQPDNAPQPLGRRGRAGAVVAEQLHLDFEVDDLALEEEGEQLCARANEYLTQEDLAAVDAAAAAAPGRDRANEAWRQARELLACRVEQSRPPAQGVTSRATRKPHPTARQTTHHGATGSRAYLTEDPVLAQEEDAPAMQIT